MRSLAARAANQLVLSYAGVVVLFTAISLASPGFAAPSHVRTLLIVAAFIGIAAIGQTFVILGGGIDLSVPWTLTGGAVLATAMAQGSNARLVWVAPVILAGGAAVGAINGAGIAVLRISPIVMTLSTNVVLQGLLLLATHGFPPPRAPQALITVATGRVGPIPYLLLLWLVLACVAVVVERRTTFGRHVYAIGSNRVVAALSGIAVLRTEIASYAISGASAALAGVLLTGYARQSYLGMGNPYLFTTIAAVAIGGTSILGGSGSYLGTAAGALVLTILTGLLPILKLDDGALEIIYGIAILATVSLTAPPVRAFLERRVQRGSPPPTKEGARAWPASP